MADTATTALLEPFSNPEAVARYAEGPRRFVFANVDMFYAVFTWRGWVAYA
jgi:hypothetical protein